MAKARRNAKTHPKPRGDDGPEDTYVPPDRHDQLRNQDTGAVEVVDVFAKTETVDTGGGGDTAVDMNSATEGDARALESEGGGDARNDDGGGRAADDVGTRGARAPRVRTPGARAAGNDDDDSSFSRRTRQRIARERALVNRERALREQTQQQLTDERAARVAQDERIARLERAQTEIAGNADVKSLQSQIDDLEPKIAAQIEAGNTLEAVKLQAKLGDLQAELKILKYDLGKKQQHAEALAAQRARQAASATTATTDPAADTRDPAIVALVNQFQKSNRHWWNRSANKAAKEDCIAIDKEILAEITAGEHDFEPYTDEHWEELAYRLHETYPDLEIQDLEGVPYEFDEDDMNDDTLDRRNGGGNGRQQQGPRQNRGAAPVRGMGHGGRKTPNEVELARQGKVTLTDEDRATMRTFKMDPNDPVAKKYFARERARSILTGNGPARGNR